MEKKYKNNKVTQLNNSLVEENNDIETPCESSIVYMLLTIHQHYYQNQWLHK